MTIHEIRHRVNYRLDRFRWTQRLLAGIHDGSHAFNGPKVVQLDIANTCSNSCLACWIRSPLLGGEVCADPVQSHQLPFEVVTRVVSELAAMKTQCIYLSGGGNVFTHPRWLDIIRLIKKSGIFLVVHANFVDFSEQEAEQLVDIGVDDLTASVWAATPEVYVATHPDKTAEDFRRMTEVLKIISQVRDKGGIFRLYNVILNKNYQELEAMLEYARSCQATSVQFAMVDIVPGKTESLLLNEDEIIRLQKAVDDIERQRDYYQQEYKLEIHDFDLFKHRVFACGADAGEYDRSLLEGGRCYVGWMYLRILADGNVNSCLKSWRFPLGNVHKQGISQIWNSTLQAEFRRKALSMAQNPDYFMKIGNNPHAEIGCIRHCDNLPNHLEVCEILDRLPLWRKGLARLACPYYRWKLD